MAAKNHRVTDEEFARDAEAFRAARIGRLTSAAGWLTLIARYPLEPGPNPLPIGTATLDENGRVTLSVVPGVTVTSDGAADPRASASLRRRRPAVPTACCTAACPTS